MAAMSLSRHEVEIPSIIELARSLEKIPYPFRKMRSMELVYSCIYRGFWAKFILHTSLASRQDCNMTGSIFGMLDAIELSKRTSESFDQKRG